MTSQLVRARIALLYTVFAAIATLANIGSQKITALIYTGWLHIYVALAVGTGVGLVTKYLLDKRYIFQFKVANLAHDGATFMLYTGTGVFTTAIFWTLELAFRYGTGSENGGYVGGVIGLAIGYWTKYRLDKRYVFNKETAERKAS